MPGLQVTGGGQTGDEIGQDVVRDGQQHQFGAAQDLGDLQDRHVRQQGLGAGAGGLRDGVDTRHHVAGVAQGGAQHGTDLACADHADAETARALIRGGGHRAGS